MIILHFHLQPQFKNEKKKELFYILHTKVDLVKHSPRKKREETV